MTLPAPVFLPADVVLDRFLRRTRTPLTDLTGRDQTREISRRRQELMWLLRQLTTASMGQIGAMLGGRTAATVDEGVDRISMRALNDPVYRKALADLREAILTPEPVTVCDLIDIRVTMAMGLLGDPGLSDQDARRGALILLRSSGHGI